MNLEPLSGCRIRRWLGALAGLLMLQGAWAGNIVLEGQNKGDTNNWYAGNLQNWLELDYIPCRVHFTLAQGNNQTFSVIFPTFNSTGIPGIEDLFNFTASSNIVFVSPPVLSVLSSSTASYTFAINILDNQPAYVWFQARLAAGAHLNTGSSLKLSGSPSSMGSLQIHKPAAAVGSPDLAVFKSGPATAAPGEVITYVLRYTNNFAAPNYATGVQLSDILPATVTILTNSIPGGRLVGSAIFWDLPLLEPGAGGQISFQVQVNATTPYSYSFTNFAQILSAENDLNYGDNTSTLVTTTVGCTAPSVWVSPLSAANCPGDSLTFSATADGTIPLKYQWFKNGTSLAGATSSAYTISSVASQDAGSYVVVVTNVCGSATSSVTTLTVNRKVVVSAGPTDQTNCPGTLASFNVSATGTGLAYQWFKDGNLLTGQTGSTLVLSNVGAGDVGTYTVVVADLCADAVTNSAALTLVPPPVISCPANKTVPLGTAWTFDMPTGNYPITILSTITNTAGDCGNSFEATRTWQAVDGCGNSALCSQTVSVVDTAPIVVALPPANQMNCPGTVATFAVAATGTGLSYSWLWNGSLLGTGTSLTLSNVSTLNGGQYSVVLTDQCGDRLTNTATLTVNSPVQISSAPTSLTNNPGTPAVFTVSASGTGLGYQWQKDGANVGGASGSSYTIASVAITDAGSYDVVVSGTCGSVTSSPALLVVNTPVQIMGELNGLTNCPGTPATFTVNAIGTGLTYQWQYAGNDIPGATGSTYSIGYVGTANAGVYDVVLNGASGSLTSAPALLVLNSPVQILSGPFSVTNCPATPASFSVNAAGAGLAYQWRKGGANITGATGSTYSIGSVSTADAGSYDVVVSGTCGSLIAGPALLVLNSPVQVLSGPTSSTNCPGTPASFTVSAVGVGVTYQWYQETNALSGVTTNTLLLPSVSATDAGNYSVVVSDVCGNSITNVATLTVNDPVMVSNGPADVITCPGLLVSFNVSASGTGLSYQWYHGANALAGATTSTLVLPGVGPSDVGVYSVTVSGACGNQGTYTAGLTLDQPVLITSPLTSLTNCAGTSATFTLGASGTGLSYQWYKDAVPLALNQPNLVVGQNGSSLTLSSASPDDAGTYSLVVSGSCGGPVTNTATLAVNQNVVVSGPPVSLTNCPGTSPSFNVAATGTGLAYQWYRNGTLLTGATSSSLALQNVSALDAALYGVVISDVCGNVVSNSASLTVDQALMVSVVPASTTNCPNTTASFTVEATGTGLNYQWYKNGTLMAGQTASSLAITNVSAADAGTYTAVASGICGNAATNSASLAINTQLLMLTQPTNQTVCPGANPSFTVEASGTGLGYQWYKDTGQLFGETNSSLILSNVSAADGGTYSVVVSGACGDPITNAATLTVNSPVQLMSGPASLTNCAGTTATLTVNASGTGLSYQWQKVGTDIGGATDSSYSIASVASADAGIYDVVVSGTCGSMTSSPALLVVNMPVQIMGGPGSLTNCPGTPASFRVVANGSGLTYQWQKDGANVTGATARTLIIGSVGSTDAGSYDVIVNGTCGSVTSAPALLVLNSPVQILSGPFNSTNCPATPANFSVNASGTGLGYQWRKGGANIGGATGSSLSLASVGSGDVASYDVIVSGTCGSLTSSPALLALNSPVQILSGPASLTNCAGTPASFSVSASGTGLSYQWQKRGANISGATDSSYGIASVAGIDAGTYDVVLSGTCGNLTSSPTLLVVNMPVQILGEPTSLTNCPGTPGIFRVVANGTGLTYQWQKDGNNIAGATARTLIIGSAGTADAGSYDVVVGGTCGSVTSTPALLDLNSPVQILSGPVSLTNCPATPASLSINAMGTGLSYQWQKDGANIVGATGNTYSIASVGNGDVASYDVIVSGTCGSLTSSPALLVLNSPVQILSGPASLTNCAGTPASFSVSASGTGLSYQWQKGGGNIGGATGSSYAIGSVAGTDAGSYDVVVSGTCGSMTSSPALLVVNMPVQIMGQPASLTNCPGTPASFRVVANGTGLTYQWQKDGANITGATTRSYIIGSVGASDAGSYDVVVSGACGSVSSTPALLVLNTPAQLLSGPANLTNCPGTSASFSVSALGTGLTYQWYKETNALMGVTSNTLVLPNVSAADAGNYSVVVGDLCGNALTNVATLTVDEPLVVANGPVSVTTCPGLPVSFSISASGTDLSFQWYKGTTALGGATNNTLVLPGVSLADAGTYSVTVGGACGNPLTYDAVLTVNQPVLLTGPLMNLTNCAGTASTFTVGATGTGLTYQWYKGGVPLTLSQPNLAIGQAGNSLTVSSVGPSDAATYSVVISDICGNSATNSATLRVNMPALVTVPPVDATVCAGSPAAFSVGASGTALSYQWYKGGQLLAGQSGSALVNSNTSTGDGGIYSVVVTGGVCGNPITNSASLTVNSLAQIVSAPGSLTNNPGTPAVFMVGATGTGLSYQWQKAGANLSGATGNSYWIASVSSTDAGSYDVVVNGTCNSLTSSPALLVVNTPLQILGGINGLTNCPGTPALFSVNATGTGLAYQWQHAGTNLNGATASSYSIASVGTADAGIYDVVLSGATGSLTSNPALLVLNSLAQIVTATGNLTNNPGTPATFTVSASGTGLSYQWQKAGANIGGATGSSYTIGSVSSTDAGSYDVVVNGTCSSLTSSPALLVVNTPVQILGGINGLTNCPGTPALFSVNATGTGLAYQWQHAGTNLNGATASSYSIASVGTADAGIYDVVLSGATGSLTSNPALLVLNSLAQIVTATGNLTNNPGTPATFTVSASGTGLSYQWQKAGANIGGATGSSYTIGSVSSTDAGSYDVVVNGTCSSLTSSPALLVVNTPLQILGGINGLTNCPGTPALFSVNATGTGLAYQWQHAGTNLNGATASSYSIASVGTADAGIYDVVLSGATGSLTSNPALLVLNSLAQIVTATGNLTNNPGTPATFTVSASGTGLSYQWQKAGANIGGATGSSYTIGSVSSTDAGSYDVVVNGTCSSLTSSPALLVVNTPLQILGGINGLTNCPGTPALFSVNATGTGLAYQWQHAGTNLNGATASSYSIASVGTADAGIYDVVLSGATGSLTSNPALLVLNSLAQIVTATGNLTNNPGTPATFTVSASGTGLSYQWQKAGANIGGATGSSYTIGSVSSTDAGSYDVVVNGTCSSLTSSPALLVVNTPVQILGGINGLTNCPGTPALFSVNATGTGLAYQWQHAGTNLNGATASSYSIASVGTADAGIYDVVLSGATGSLTSNPALLVLNSLAQIVTATGNLTNNPGTPATFTVSASGTGLSYQWQKAGANIGGATGSSYTIGSVSSTDAGSYDVVVNGTCSSLTSSPALLVVNTPVQILGGINGLTNCPGTPALFSVNATGTGLAYQWQHAGTNLNGATASSYSIASVGTADAGIYDVVLSGATGSLTSNPALLVLNSLAQIVTATGNLTNNPGTPATFTVSASGTGLSYQWQKAGANIGGATGSSYTIGSVSSTDAGSYDVVVNGTCSSLTSSPALLVVNTPVQILGGINGLTNCPGTPALFSVNATGTGLAYQWQHAGTNLNGATASSYSIASVGTADAGIYDVVLSGATGSLTSNPALLVLNSLAQIVTATGNLTNNPGTPATFTVSASGTGLSYQWQKAGANIGGATGSSYTIGSVSSTDAGSYDVVVNGTCSSLTSSPALLVVNTPVQILGGINGLTNCPGTPALFSVNATGTGLAYQWQHAGTNLNGATASSYSIASVGTADAGIYDVVLSGATGSLTSNPALLVLNSLAQIVTATGNLTNNPGTPATFTVSASGTGLSYQWQKAGANIGGATGSSYTIGSVSSTDAGSYDVVVNGTCSSLTSSPALLVVNTPVQILGGINGLTNCPGTPALFSVNATGTGLAYQWQHAGTNLNGATASSYSIASVGTADAGIYDVVLSGATGSLTSNPALLVLNSLAQIVTATGNLTNNPGTPATFTVSASGTGLSYQWQKAGANIGGATGSSYTIGSVSSTDAGSYDVVVNGTCSSLTSSPALLVVNTPVQILGGINGLTNCPGTPALFSVNATGTGLAYQWQHAGTNLNGATASSYSIASVGTADAGIYDVVLSGATGSLTSNPALLVLNSTTTVTPLAGTIKNLGDSVTFSTTASGTGPFAYVWKKNGTVIAGATLNRLTLTNLGYADGAVYSVEVSGLCNTAVQAATLTINHPPTVTIITPTNGTIFIAPVDITVLANAQDVDGTVTNVNFFLALTNEFGQVASSPYTVVLTNPAPGSYTFLATATDNLGAMGTSAPVSVTVISNVPSVSGPIRLNYQTGFYEQTVTITNPTPITLDAVGVIVTYLPTGWRVQNATFTTNGLPGLLFAQAIPPGGSASLTIKYYLGSGANPNATPVLSVINMAMPADPSLTGIQTHISHAQFLADGTFLLNFSTSAGATYYIQYSADLRNWSTSPYPVSGTGNFVQWIDYGPPATSSLPKSASARFYRVIQVVY